jgi:hypothetical protein
MSWVQKLLNKIRFQLLRNRRYYYLQLVLIPVSWSSSYEYIATDCQSARSPWCPAPFGAGDQMLHFFEWELRFYFFMYGALTDERTGLFHVWRPLWREDGYLICSAMTQVQFQVILQQTVCRAVRLGAGPLMGPWPDFNFFVWQLLYFFSV